MGNVLMGKLSKLHFLRKKLGLTQRDFGKKLGIAQGYISDIESGRKIPSDTVWILLGFLIREWEGTNQIQSGSKALIENKEEREEGIMYRDKYLDLLEKYILLQEEIKSIQEELKKATLPKVKLWAYWLHYNKMDYTSLTISTK